MILYVQYSLLITLMITQKHFEIEGGFGFSSRLHEKYCSLEIEEGDVRSGSQSAPAGLSLASFVHGGILLGGLFV